MSRVFIAPIVVVCLLGHAEALLAQPISGGVKAGVTSARLPGVTEAVEIAVDEESRWGGTFGAFVTVPLNELVAFQPEALYVAKGSTLGSSAVGYSLSFDIRYLEVPLFFKFGRSSQRLYLLAGPYVGVRLSAEGREVIGSASDTRDVSDMITRVDAGVSFGAGVTFNRFLVEGRWSEGLRDAESRDQFATAVRHRVLAVLAGVRF